MSKGLVRKLLILAIGILLVLIGFLYQIRQNNPDSTSPPGSGDEASDPATVLTNSLQQQRRQFQRCWLRTSNLSGDSLEEKNQLTWQIFLKVQPSGKVVDFALLNKALFDAETEKCLREISYRLKFPSFSGNEVSISVPIVISNISENH